MTTRLAFVVALAALAVGFGAQTASAHKLGMSVKLSAADITVKTGFDGADHGGGDAVTVTVSKPDKEVVATGKTGPDGTWTTPNPPPGEYVVVAADDFGHRAEQRIEIRAGGPPVEYKADEPPLPSGLGAAVGVGFIGIVTLAAYWFLSRKKA